MNNRLITKSFSILQFVSDLHLEFDDISYPLEYVDQIRGYYIVQQERTTGNKTILDKGLIHRNAFFHMGINDVGKKDRMVQCNIDN